MTYLDKVIGHEAKECGASAYCTARRAKIESKIPGGFPLQVFVDGMQAYKEAYGNPWVEHDFVFPKSDKRIPNHVRGMALPCR